VSSSPAFETAFFVLLHPDRIPVLTYLLLDHILVDFSGGDIVIPRKSDIQVSLIISQVEVGLSPVVEDINHT
jgi:hypothetical protein